MLIQIYYDTEDEELGIREANSILFHANKYGCGLQCNYNALSKEYIGVKRKCFEIKDKIKELIELNKLEKEIQDIDNFFDNMTTEEFDKMLVRNGIEFSIKNSENKTDCNE